MIAHYREEHERRSLGGTEEELDKNYQYIDSLRRVGGIPGLFLNSEQLNLIRL